MRSGGIAEGVGDTTKRTSQPDCWQTKVRVLRVRVELEVANEKRGGTKPYACDE